MASIFSQTQFVDVNPIQNLKACPTYSQYPPEYSTSKTKCRNDIFIHLRTILHKRLKNNIPVGMSLLATQRLYYISLMENHHQRTILFFLKMIGNNLFVDQGPFVNSLVPGTYGII